MSRQPLRRSLDPAPRPLSLQRPLGWPLRRAQVAPPPRVMWSVADLDFAEPPATQERGARETARHAGSVERVLIVGDYALINGGQPKIAIDTATLLADRGLGVTYFAACGPVTDALLRPEIEVVCLDQSDILSDENRLRAMRRGIWNREAARRLAETAARYDPRKTVLHCHGYAKALSPAIGPILTDGPLRSVYTMHEYFLACPNGGFYDYQANRICTRRAMGAACLARNCDARKWTHKAWRVARQAATIGPGRIPRRLRDIITISKIQGDVLAPYLGPETRLHHVPNPLPSLGLPRVDTQENDVFLFVGRLDPEKGAVHFAKAARALGVRAVFVGDGRERPEILKANPDAEMLGWLSPEGVQNEIARAKVLVFPSLWYEGFPLVPLEALSRGVPVVAGAWSAASEAVLDGINGTIYQEPTVEALSEAMTRSDGIDPEGVSLKMDLSLDRHFGDLMRVYEGL